MKIVALDLSLTATGCATSTGAEVTASVLSPPKGLGDMERLEWIRRSVIHAISTEPKPLIAIEDFAFAAANQAHQIGMLHGVVRLTLWKLGFQVVYVAPAMLKKFVTGSGAAKKEVMIRDVYARFGVTCANNNEADAVGLCFIGLALAGLWQPTTNQQRDVLEALRTKFAWLKQLQKTAS